MKPITFKTIGKQLKADLIGKDSYRGVTLTYTWLANQFGHFSLGYIPTLIAYFFLICFWDLHHPALIAAFIVAGMWLVFETYNFLGPLLMQQNSHSKLVFLPKSKYTFQPAWGNVAFDTVTDISYFWLGAFSASFFCTFSWQVFIVIHTLLVLLAYPAYYWYTTKMYIQYAEYPYQFRLSQWDHLPITEADRQTVLHYMKADGGGNHLLVFGGENSGKTSLSVGIATEKSIKHQSSKYVTAEKLLGLFCDEDRAPDEEAICPWTWRDGAWLIIDDISPGYPVTEDIISAPLFLKYLNNCDHGAENIACLKRKNVIWVLGRRMTDRSAHCPWETILQKIGVDRSRIASIDLGDRKN